jgi:hypothetical protein
MWTDGNNAPTADGKKYAPSMPASYAAARSFKISQIEANADWELEADFGDNGADYADPAVIHNTKYDGRVAIVFQNGDSMPRGQVIVEILDNWLSQIVKAQPVESEGKLPLTWGEIKRGI